MASQHIKCVVIGPSGAGKTCLLKRIERQTYNEDEGKTVGMELYLHKVSMKDGHEISFKLFDSAGSNIGVTQLSSYYRTSQVFMAVFDVSDIQSFRNLQVDLLPKLAAVRHDHVVLVVGAKSDKKRAVSREEGEAMVKSMLNENQRFCTYIEASASTNDNVTETFYELGKLYEQLRQEEELRSATMTSSERGCCLIS
eukprot:g1438.t1